MLVESYEDLSDWKKGNEIETKREKISKILLDLSIERENQQKMNICSVQSKSGVDLENIKRTSEEKQSVANVPREMMDYIEKVKRKQNDFTLIRKYK